MSKITLTYTIIVAVLFLSGCSPSSLRSKSDSRKPSPALRAGNRRIYDCAANNLYDLCRKSNIEISYQECLELLPFTPEGNSMLEFKGALMSLGFEVEAVRLTPDEFANVRVPTVLLMLPPEKSWTNTAEPFVGHYRVLRPLNEESLEILDYPRDPVVVSTDYWIRHLRRIGVKNVPVLLCGKWGQALDEMLLPLQVTAKPSSASKNMEEKTKKMSKDPKE